MRNCKNLVLSFHKDAVKSGESKASRLLERVELHSLLDCGCGEITMRVVRYIGAEDVYGIDIDSSVLSELLKKEIKVTRCNLNQCFPFENSCFNVVRLNQIIEHYKH